MSISGKAYLANCTMPIGCFAFSAKAATVRLALAPISVPLPPRQAPRASAHHTGSKVSGGMPCPADCRSGIMVATKGMLSNTEESSAETQSTA